MEQSDGTLILEQVQQIGRGGTQVCLRHEGDITKYERGQEAAAADESERGFGRSSEASAAAAAAPRPDGPTGVLQVARAGRVGGGRGSAQGAGCEQRISGGEVGALRGLLRRVRAAQHPKGTSQKYC